MNNPPLNLITGAAGHLGNVLARTLLERGERVRALVLPGEDLTSLAGLEIEIVEGNVADLDSLIRATTQVDYVFHLAAVVSLLDVHAPILTKVNVDGTRNMLEAARKCGVKRFVYTSSIHALTRPPHGIPIDESMPFDPHNPAGAYDRSKAEASLAVLDAARAGLDAVIACPTGVIGPYDFRRSEMGEMILSWMKAPLSWLIPGQFDFVDVRDVADGHIRVRDLAARGETYILGGELISVPRIAQIVRQAVGKKLRPVIVPINLALVAAFFAEWYYRISHTRPKFTRYSIETLVSNSAISSAKAIRELGYRPRDLMESIHETVQWWMKNKSLTRASVRV